jgi:predicted GNAT family acetyltransferase
MIMRSGRGRRTQMNKKAKKINIVAPYIKDACKGHITSN